MFSLENIRHGYDGREVLRLDHWSVGQGEHWLILGPSGSGKSTLLHILAGIVTPTAGSVSVAGQGFATLRPSRLDRFRGRNIGIVFQRMHLISSLTVLENLLLAQYLAAARADARAARVLLADLGLAEAAHKRPHALSVGELQRAAVARAVVNKPCLILADEPTSHLDDANATAALDLLLAQAGSCNATLVIATHDRRTRDRFEHQINLEAAA
jgi:putative ABC transport system ATP-binding protein